MQSVKIEAVAPRHASFKAVVLPSSCCQAYPMKSLVIGQRSLAVSINCQFVFLAEIAIGDVFIASRNLAFIRDRDDE